MDSVPPLSISEFDYDLPENRIAKYPLKERDTSKLLVYKNGKITHSVFNDIQKFLPTESIIVFNETKVIEARLIFKRDSGAEIEVFCLNPIAPSADPALAMQAKKTTIWKCMVGNLKKWRADETISNGNLNAALLIKEGYTAEVEFTWDTEQTWAEILETYGQIPLPPYLNRDSELSDKKDYQTVFAREPGAVAAPTASLHFTSTLTETLKQEGHALLPLILHVSAGTFQPVTVKDISQHTMHSELINIAANTIRNLYEKEHTVIAAGTTSLRTLESLYWFGVMLQENKELTSFHIPQFFPYEFHQTLSKRESLENVLIWMEHHHSDTLTGATSLMIMPGYSFKMCDGLITNFHQPKSTLLMLVAAFTKNNWKEIYREAMQKDYRFLSYGDGSLLMR